MDDLVLLGAININSGNFMPPEMLPWEGPRAGQLPYTTLMEALQAPDRWGAEGLVVHFGPLRHHAMVKIKQEEYVRLHRIVTGLSERAVWEWIKEGKTLDELCATVPEEFWEWIRKIGGDLIFGALDIYRAAEAEYHQILVQAEDEQVEILDSGQEHAPQHGDLNRVLRKSFARRAATSEYRPWLFMMFDRRDPAVIQNKIFDTLRPVGLVTPFGTVMEEEA
jgi:RNA ligase